MVMMTPSSKAHISVKIMIKDALSRDILVEAIMEMRKDLKQNH
jgi:hypothetical protein